MEHRCGQRFGVNLPAVLHLLNGQAVPVTMRDLSSGGAFVETPAGLPALRAPVELEVRSSRDDAACLWRGWVIRLQAEGAGLLFDEAQLASRLAFLAARRRRTAWRP